jgi:hypothetical protein
MERDSKFVTKKPLFYPAVLLLLFFVLSLQAANQRLRFFAQPGGQVTVQGGHKPWDWEVQGRVIEGTFECGSGFPVKNGQVVKPGKMQGVMAGSIPLRSLHSCYGSLMDEFMYSAMNETNAPRILFHFSDLVLTNLPATKNIPYRFHTRAELVLAGVTNRMSMPVSVMPLAGDRLQISGKTFIKLADLGMQASRAVSLFVKNGDEVQLSFDWLVGRKPFLRNWK